MIKEEFLYYVWKNKNFDFQDLRTTDGRRVEIIDFGLHNHHSGPDFSNGKVKIDDVVWAGNIEMHLSSSDWLLHKHQYDKAYENVVLHVVYDHDRDIVFADGKELSIPTIELKGRINTNLLENYVELMSQTYWIPCQNLLNDDLLTRLDFSVDRLLIDRLERKTFQIEDLLQQSNNDWEKVLLILIAKYMGGSTNADSMEALLKGISREILLKNRDNRQRIEALLFGHAGLLEIDTDDDYVASLRDEYNFLKTKYGLVPLKKESWKFFGGRPAGFPTIRIGQLASIVLRNSSLFSSMIKSEQLEDIRSLFEVETHLYWDTHYVFGAESKSIKKKITTSLVDRIIINAIIPLLFCYSKSIGDQDLIDKIVDWMYGMKKEKNSIISKWEGLGVSMDSAAHSQAYLQLKNEYCNLRRCIECPVGSKIIKG